MEKNPNLAPKRLSRRQWLLLARLFKPTELVRHAALGDSLSIYAWNWEGQTEFSRAIEAESESITTILRGTQFSLGDRANGEMVAEAGPDSRKGPARSIVTACLHARQIRKCPSVGI